MSPLLLLYCDVVVVVVVVVVVAVVVLPLLLYVVSRLSLKSVRFDYFLNNRQKQI
jgi:uncharacterized membrane protein YcaP (DUF421 family)